MGELTDKYCTVSLLIYIFRINAITDPVISSFGPEFFCKKCGRSEHSVVKCSAISKGTPEDAVFFSMVKSVMPDSHEDIEPDTEEEVEVWV